MFNKKKGGGEGGNILKKKKKKGSNIGSCPQVPVYRTNNVGKMGSTSPEMNLVFR